MRIVHISDPHLSSLDAVRPWRLRGKRWLGYLSWRRRRRHVHRREVLSALIEAVHAEGADHWVVTGDLTQLGLAEEMDEALRWLRALAPPENLILVPGNHDAYAADAAGALPRQWQEYLHWQALADGPAEPPGLQVKGDCAFLGVSSAHPSGALLATGTVGEAQRQRLARMLDEQAAAGRFRCVLIHHPPLPGSVGRRKALTDARALTRVIAEHGAELILHGHVHRNVDRMLEAARGDIPVCAVAPASGHPGYGHQAASYRVFDIAREGQGWRLEERLAVMRDDGTFAVTAAAKSHHLR